ncbi:STAS domain-containing protein [Streptomyces longwoodensis]|uniref:STAS domain-containing protein n=1 Tax=Streptomyces longwoodensis TaxID=68231 RepID=UPI0033B7D8B8
MHQREGASSGRAPAGDCRCLVLDTASLTFIDSSGITALLALWHRLGQRQGALILAIPEAPLRQRMHYLGLDNIFCITATLDEAITQARALGVLTRPRTAQTEADHT